MILLMASLFTGCATKANVTMLDPEYGKWDFYESEVDGTYSTQNLEYVARNGKRISNLYATSGFYEGIAFVATCDLIKNDRTCAQWHYYMIDPNGETIADFSNYILPQLGLCTGGSPSSIFITADSQADGKSVDFPMFKSAQNSCTKQYLTTPAFNAKRILVYDKTLDRFGYMDFSGNMAIPATLKLAQPFQSNGMARVLTGDNIPGYIDQNGNFTPDKYMCVKELENSIKPPHELFQVSSLGKIYNYVSEKTLNIKPMFATEEMRNTAIRDNATYENCAGDKVGIIDQDLNEIIPPIYDEIIPSGIYAVTKVRYFKAIKDGFTDYYRYRYGDKQVVKMADSNLVSKVIYGPHCALMQSATSGLWNAYSSLSKTESQTGFIYDDVKYQPYLSEEGIASQIMAMRRNSKYAIVNCAIGEVIEPKYDDVRFRSVFDTDLLVTVRKKKLGLVVNTSEFFKPVFDWIDEFDEEKALAKIGQKKYYIFYDNEKEKRYNMMVQHRKRYGEELTPVYPAYSDGIDQ